MTLLLQHWFGITPGISGLCLDALCYFLGFRMLGRVFLKNALTASLCFSVFYNLFEHAGYLYRISPRIRWQLRYSAAALSAQA